MRPQKIVTHRDGTGLPCWLIEPITIEAESAEVTKKITIDTRATTLVIAPSGSASSSAKSCASGEPAPLTPAPCVSNHMVVPPTTPNQTRHTADGTTMTTVTNSRSVRPRDIFAMNRPTNGDHDARHAQ